MSQHYLIQSLYGFAMYWAVSCLFSTQAQTLQPPVAQWQRVIDENNTTQTSSLRAVKSARSGYGILVGNRVMALTATGQTSWTTSVPGSYADSSTNWIAVQQTLALASTNDGGFVALALDGANRYYVTKLDSVGNSTWTRTVARADAGPQVQLTATGLATDPDGSILVAGSYVDSRSYLALTKLSSEGYIVAQWRINLPDFAQPTSVLIRQILPVSDQGYLLVGRAVNVATTESKGIAIQLDKQHNLTWKQLYPNLTAILAVVAKPASDNTYIALGTGMGAAGQAITIAPNQAGDGAVLASLPGFNSPVSLASDGVNTLTFLDTALTNNGDFRLANGSISATLNWTKTFGGAGVDVPADLLPTDDGGYLVIGTTTSTDGDIQGKMTAAKATWILKLGTSAQLATLRLLRPIYDCQTGFIQFQTSGGDGSPITFTAPGITRTSGTDTFGTVEQALRNDPKVIVIQASQSGQTVRYSFDLGAYCRTNLPTAQGDTLKLVAPTYNCQTGAITFHSTGGDGSPIEYAASGVTDWTTNPDQFVDPALRTASDAQPLLLRARQQGRVVTYVFNSKAACGRARQAADDSAAELSVRVLGNPAHETALVEITGAENQSIGMQLYDARGRLIEQATIQKAGRSERQRFDLRHQAVGTFLLHTTVNDQLRTVKFIKQ
ncbi:T9SS type A sorting domain-containing protein [Spirosoma jeollabukense]